MQDSSSCVCNRAFFYECCKNQSYGAIILLCISITTNEHCSLHVIDVSNCQYQLHKLSHIRLDTWENALIPVPYAKMIGSGKRKKVSARCVLSLVRLANTKKKLCSSYEEIHSCIHAQSRRSTLFASKKDHLIETSKNTL